MEPLYHYERPSPGESPGLPKISGLPRGGPWKERVKMMWRPLKMSPFGGRGGAMERVENGPFLC